MHAFACEQSQNAMSTDASKVPRCTSTLSRASRAGSSQFIREWHAATSKKTRQRRTREEQTVGDPIRSGPRCPRSSVLTVPLPLSMRWAPQSLRNCLIRRRAAPGRRGHHGRCRYVRTAARQGYPRGNSSGPISGRWSQNTGTTWSYPSGCTCHFPRPGVDHALPQGCRGLIPYSAPRAICGQRSSNGAHDPAPHRGGQAGPAQ
jgi:hypothetical protein